MLSRNPQSQFVDELKRLMGENIYLEAQQDFDRGTLVTATLSFKTSTLRHTFDEPEKHAEAMARAMMRALAQKVHQINQALPPKPKKTKG